MAFNLKKKKKKRAPPPIAERPSKISAASPFTAMTPAEFAELFPKYYNRGRPDIGGFHEAISRKERRGMGLPEKQDGSTTQYGEGKTVAKGNLASNQKEAYKAAREAGLSDSAARILVANMSGESLANPGDHHWDVKHMSQGIVQWDPERSERIRRQFGAYPKDMSVAEQTKAAIWEMKTYYGRSWDALNDENLSAGERMHTVVEHYERPRDVSGSTAQRMRHFNGLPSSFADQPDLKPDAESSKIDKEKSGVTVKHGHGKRAEGPDVSVTPQKVAHAPGAPITHTADVGHMSAADFLVNREKQKGTNQQTASITGFQKYAQADTGIMSDATAKGNVTATNKELVSDEVKKNAILKISKDLNIDPHALATAMLYETIGSLDHNKEGVKDRRRASIAAQKNQGAHNKFLGMLQFGSTEQLKYGIKKGQSFEEHMEAVGRYLKDRKLVKWMDEHPNATDKEKRIALYSTINAGSPYEKNWKKTDKRFGGSATTVAQKVDIMDRDYGKRATALLNVPSEEETKLAAAQTTKAPAGPPAPEQQVAQTTKAPAGPPAPPEQVAQAPEPKKEKTITEKIKSGVSEMASTLTAAPTPQAKEQPAPVTPAPPVSPPFNPPKDLKPLMESNIGSNVSNPTVTPVMTQKQGAKSMMQVAPIPGASDGGKFHVGDSNVNFYPMDKKDNMVAVNTKTQQPLFTARTDEKVSVDRTQNTIDVAPTRKAIPPNEDGRVHQMNNRMNEIYDMTANQANAPAPTPRPAPIKPERPQAPVVIDSFLKQGTTGFPSPSLERAMNKARGRESDYSANRIGSGTSIA